MSLFHGALLFALIWSSVAEASGPGGLPLDPSNFADPSALISKDLANSAARAMGLVLDHRPYEPATTLSPPVGFDASIETTIAKIPEEFTNRLKSVGLISGSLISAVPVPKFNVHKALGTRAEVGVSAMGYREYRVIGMDFKLNIYKPDEGLAWALRLNYNTAKIGFLKTESYTPEILVSTPLDFAEPYLGLGYQYAKADIEISLDPRLPTARASGAGGGFLAFMGVGFKVPGLGVRLTLEGAYSGVGVDTLGTKFGFCF